MTDTNRLVAAIPYKSLGNTQSLGLLHGCKVVWNDSDRGDVTNYLGMIGSSDLYIEELHVD